MNQNMIQSSRFEKNEVFFQRKQLFNTKPLLKRLILFLFFTVSALQAGQVLNDTEKAKLSIYPIPKEVSKNGKALLITKQAKNFVLFGKSMLSSPIKKRIAALKTFHQTTKYPENYNFLLAVFSITDTKLTNKLLTPAEIKFLKNKQNGQTYLIKTLSNMVVLAGSGPIGALYAEVSWENLLKSTPSTLTIGNYYLRDYPDFKRRGAVMRAYKDGQTQYRQGVKDIDLCLKYKLNFLTNNFSAPWARDQKAKIAGDMPSPEKCKWLKKLNDYARERGVTIGWLTTTGVGLWGRDKNNPAFKDVYVIKYGTDTAEYYYAWSREDLFRRRTSELGRFAAASGADMMIFHSPDGGVGPFYESKCKKAFKNDRASADANIVNRFTSLLHKYRPELTTAFVFYPYNGNLDNPKNKKLRRYYTKLSSKIPKNVYLVSTDFLHPYAASWGRHIKQPVIRWQNMTACNSGLFFSAFTVSAPSLFIPKHQNDIWFLNEVIHSNGKNDVHVILGNCYAWNTNLKGKRILTKSGREKYSPLGEYYTSRAIIDNMQDTEWLVNAGATTPKFATENLLNGICISRYGRVAGPILAKFFRLGIIRGITPFGGYNLLRKTTGNKALYKQLNQPEWLKYQLEKCKIAISLLSPLKKNKNLTREIHNNIAFFLHDSIVQKIFYSIILTKRKAELHLAKSRLAEAEATLNQGSAEVKKMMSNAGLSKRESSNFSKRTDKAFKILHERINIYRQLQSSQSKKPSIGIYYPDENAGGKTFGVISIWNLLNKEKRPAKIITSLSPEVIRKYKVLIISGLMKFGFADRKFIDVKKNLRYYVKNGGRLFLAHNAVGIARSELRESIFPEVCTGAVARSLQKNLKKAPKEAFFSCLNPNSSYPHLYSDHLTLTCGPNGKTALLDVDNAAVCIYGKVGKGKVFFTGTILLDEKHNNLHVANGIDGIILNTALSWLLK
jgi:hypothetical protein